ncbi:MAG: kinase [Pseudomonadales bacterium]|nr:kinase [Pseudomonadales bacterium]
MLYVFGGLPSSGKSVLSRYLAEQIGAMHIRIDSIEQLLRVHAGINPVGVAGYVSAYAIAKNNLDLGHTVIADSVNPIQVTREAWKAVADEAGTDICEIEVICSDVVEHKARYIERISDIDGLEYGPWEDVLNREYEDWISRDLLIDTASKSIGESQSELLSKVEGFTPG